jgi:ATP-binding cassette subfamily B protein
MTVLSNSLWALKFVFSISKLYSILFFVSELFKSIVPILTTYIGAKILDIVILQDISRDEKVSQVLVNVISLFLIMSVRDLAGQISNYSRSYISRTMRISGYERIHEKAAHLSLEQLEDPEVINLMKRANENIRQTIDLYRSIILVLTSTVAFIADALIILAFMPLYVLAYTVSTVIYFFPVRYFIKKEFQYYKDWTEPYRKAMQTTDQLTNATYLKEIRVNESYRFFDTFFKSIRKPYLGGLFKIRYQWALTEILLGLPLLFIYFFGYFATILTYIDGLITLGTMTFRFSSISRFNYGIASIVEEMNYVSEFSININECRLFINLKPTDIKSDVAITSDRAPEIFIKDLSFKYKNTDKFVIKNLNLSIKSGEKIAIVGHNGAGKTTLIKLLSKIYDTEQGEILVNGMNLNNVNAESYFKNLGVLFQDFVNYGQISIRDNIALEEKTTRVRESDIVKAAKLADAHEFIEELPLKYDTVPSERYKGGVRLSGGQGQKLALARFFYKDAPLLIFDEPTSAIDAVSEFKIFNNIYDFFRDKTVIIISHRFSTVRNADRIIVMAHGEIVEEGNHKELMEKNGVYAESYNLQAGEYTKAS